MRDRELDAMYDWVDERMRLGRFEDVDAVCGFVWATFSAYCPSYILGILTVTLPAKNRLPNRTLVFEGARNLMLPEILKGLEP